MIAERGTPVLELNSGEMQGQFSAGAVKRELGCAEQVDLSFLSNFAGFQGLPVQSMQCSGSFGKSFPPNGHIVGVKRNVGEDCAALCGLQCVVVGVLVSAGGNAKEAVFGVDSPKSAVLAYANPRNVVADRFDFIARLFIVLGGISIARLVLPHAEGNAAATYFLVLSGKVTPRISICSAIQPSFLPR